MNRPRQAQPANYRLAFCLLVVIISAVALAGWGLVSVARAREGAPGPAVAPVGLTAAKRLCSDSTSIVECRAALRRQIAAAAWERTARLALARQLVGNVAAWSCIHSGVKGDHRVGNGEASWTDAGDPYWGGLQMDRNFMREYGADMLRRHHGGLANTWTPREQIIVAQRAFAQGRGYRPWPQTARACGLI